MGYGEVRRDRVEVMKNLMRQASKLGQWRASTDLTPSVRSGRTAASDCRSHPNQSATDHSIILQSQDESDAKPTVLVVSCPPLTVWSREHVQIGRVRERLGHPDE